MRYLSWLILPMVLALSLPAAAQQQQADQQTFGVAIDGLQALVAIREGMVRHLLGMVKEQDAELVYWRRYSGFPDHPAPRGPAFGQEPMAPALGKTE